MASTITFKANQVEFNELTENLRAVFTDGSTASLQSLIDGFTVYRDWSVGEAILKAAREADPRVMSIIYAPPAPQASGKHPDFGVLAHDIHAENVRAGWWSDLTTGESTLHTRNRPELLMLAVSEGVEAVYGVTGNLDDKLPHLPMYDVELADFVIRLLDQIGAEIACGHKVPIWGDGAMTLPLPSTEEIRAISRSDRLMDLIACVAQAMEAYRKGRINEYLRAMASGVLLAFQIAGVDRIDLFDVIAQKRAYNRDRADHKPENRRKDGGKAF